MNIVHGNGAERIKEYWGMNNYAGKYQLSTLRWAAFWSINDQ